MAFVYVAIYQFLRSGRLFAVMIAFSIGGNRLSCLDQKSLADSVSLRNFYHLSVTISILYPLNSPLQLFTH
jgi:hypothetical protein